MKYIWRSQPDYYNKEYMEEIKNTNYKDYLEELDSKETPKEFKEWYEIYIDSARYTDMEEAWEECRNFIIPRIRRQINKHIVIVMDKDLYNTNVDSDYITSYIDSEQFRVFQLKDEELERYLKDKMKEEISHTDYITVNEDNTLGIDWNTLKGDIYTVPEAGSKELAEMLRRLGFDKEVEKTYDKETLERANIDDLMEVQLEDDGVFDSDLFKVKDLWIPIENTNDDFDIYEEDKEGEEKEND